MIMIFPTTTSFQDWSSVEQRVTKSEVFAIEESVDVLFSERVGEVVLSSHNIYSRAAMLQTSRRSFELQDKKTVVVMTSICKKNRKGKKERTKLLIMEPKL